ncbi:hypothetical protein [Acinetobacter sp. NigerLNRRAM0016]
MNVKQLLDVIHSDVTLDSAEEIKSNIEFIIRVQEMSSGEQDTIMAAFKHGPLYDGDVPSKSGRDLLLKDGFISKVIVKGDDGFNACTHKGGRAYRILMAMRNSSQ